MLREKPIISFVLHTAKLENSSETVFAELLTDEKTEELYSKGTAEADVLDNKLFETSEKISNIMMSLPAKLFGKVQIHNE